MTDIQVTQPADFCMGVVDNGQPPLLTFEEAKAEVEKRLPRDYSSDEGLYFSFGRQHPDGQLGTTGKYPRLSKETFKQVIKTYRDAGWVVFVEPRTISKSYVFHMACRKHKLAVKYAFKMMYGFELVLGGLVIFTLSMYGIVALLRLTG